MSSRIRILALLGIAVSSAQAPVHAYIDPGSTSLFLQALVGGVAALLVVTRSYWTRLVSRFRKTDDGNRSEPE
ncbi:MAG: hypothetical protein WD227_12500 [Vicinamibacterales bacterium]